MSPRVISAPLFAGIAAFMMSACQPAQQSAATRPATAVPAPTERWQVTPRGEDRIATVSNAQGFLLALGCGGTGSSGRYMDVTANGQTAGGPQGYDFIVFSRGQSIFAGNAAVGPSDSNDGSAKVVAPLSVEAVQALRKGNSVEIAVDGSGTQRFSLAGSKAAINSSSCGV